MTIELGDGCTGWFDGWPGGPSWRHCCDVHDWAMHSQTDLLDWARSGAELAWCVSQVDVFMGLIMGIGVLSPVGAALFIFGNKKKGVR